MSPSLSPAELHALAARRFALSCQVPLDFFEAQAEPLALACLALARRFARGGRLLAFGAGNAATDAQHVSVEFVHPVVVGKRALPALALGTDLAATLGLAAQTGRSGMFARQIQTLGRPEDIALGIDPAGDDRAVASGLATARERGLLTLGLTRAGGRLARAAQLSSPKSELDFVFAVPSDDPAVIQETHETLYHILWELVHVFFEHKGVLDPPEQAERVEHHA